MSSNIDKKAGEDFASDDDLKDRDYDEEEAETHPTGNPAPPPDVDLELFRGDRIGDTVYSGKWCIEIVMKLMQSNVVMREPGEDEGRDNLDNKLDVVDMDEDLQNQVGVLWDMTGNEEVCIYLHSVGAVDSICFVLAKSRCPRATEMCAGMLANIITHEVMWKALHNDTTIISILVPLLANEDQPTLLEITRFFNTALCHSEHSHCYASLYENSGLVLQELARILSGSTNGDLLKHSAEMVHTLLDLDQEDKKFCAVFAEQDFILACVEASKELGYQQVSSGQNHLMDVLYRFTTYEAGLAALESCVEPVAVACSSYLTHLCEHLSLSNNCATMTTTLATLNHVFCRQRAVQHTVLAAPRLFGYILKVLVTVYTRLGLYSAISSSVSGGEEKLQVKKRSRDRSPKPSLEWTDLDDTPSKSSRAEPGSWSERAIAASGGSSNIPTPEASPLTRHDCKELDISWSERRMATPLADQYVEQVWKMPHSTKKVVKKSGRNTSPEKSSKEPDESNASMEDTGVKDSSHVAPEQGSTTSTSHEEKKFEAQREEDATQTAEKKIHKVDPFAEEDTRKSGFIPSRSSEDVDKCEEDEKSRHMETEDDKLDRRGSDVNRDHSRPSTKTTLGRTSSNDSSDEEDLESGKVKGDDLMSSFEAVADSMQAGEDKYNNLLGAIQEFFADVFNSCKEMGGEPLTTDPPIGELIRYLDKRCNRTEIRALTKCLSSGENLSVVEQLLAFCELFNTARLDSVISGFLRKKREERGEACSEK